MVVRPAVPEDIEGLLGLASALGSGVTTLPPDRDLLAGRIEDSVASFARPVRTPAGEWYLFVLCDAAGRLRGTSAVVARVGGFDPYYTYDIRTEVHAHEPLGVHHSLQVMHLHREHKGPSELASLAVDPALRRQGMGRVLSLSRLLFMAAHRNRFADEVVVELRGHQDADGRSPFWDSVGHHFFDREFADADFLSGLGNKDFIEDLMPTHPIYLTLLPPHVRDAVGRPHAHSAPAMRMLEGQGMRYSGKVDIFDAGPILSAAVDDLHAVRMQRVLTVSELRDADPVDAVPALIANGRLDFRALRGGVEYLPDGTVAMARAQGDALRLEPGQTVQVLDD